MLDNICICKICGKECKSTRQLSHHIQIEEKVSLKNYFDKFMKTPNEGVCPCCGKETKFLSLKYRYTKHCSKECLAKTRGIKNSAYMTKFFSNIENRKIQSNRLKYSIKHKESCTNSIEFKNKMSNIRKEAYKNKEYYDKMNKLTHNEQWKNSVTSKEFRENTSNNNTKRIIEGKVFKIYKYDNQWFDSKPELAFYIWLKDHNVRFRHEKIYLNYKYNDVEYKYIPDFIVYDTFVEIKGKHLLKRMLHPNTKDNAKYKCMLSNKVHIITEYDKYLRYVENKYGKDYMLRFKIND